MMSNFYKKFCACICSIIAVVIISYLILRNTTIDREHIKKIIESFAYGINQINPEPGERRAFFASIITFPLISLGSLIVLEKIRFKKWKSLINQILMIMSIIAVIGLTWLDLYNINYFFIRFTPYFKVPISLITLPILATLIIAAEKKAGLNTVIRKISTLTVSIILILFISFHTFRIDTLLEFHHFNAVFHAMSQVFEGKIITQDFAHQYGLYPHFIEPILSITSTSVFAFTLLMGILVALSFLFIYLVLRAVTKNAAISIFGFISIISFNFIDTLHQQIIPNPYFQYFPIRTIFPMFIMWWGWKYMNHPQPKIKYIGYLAGAIALLWNLDTGSVTLLTWFITMGYCEALNWKKDGFKKVIKQIATDIGIGIGITLLTALSFKGYMYVRYGYSPLLSLLNEYQQIFYINGFYMAPMPLIHPWNIIVLIYGLGLINALYALIKGKSSRKTNAVFLLSILGIGIFSYYQGRSLNELLIGTWYPAQIILIIWLSSMIKSLLKKDRNYWHKAMSYIIIALIITGTASAAYNIKLFFFYKKNKFQLFSESQDQREHMLAAEFIKEKTSQHEGVLIISDQSGIYHEYSHTYNPVKIPGVTELILKKDYDLLLNAINKKSVKKIYIDLHFRENKITEEIKDALEKNYVVNTINNEASLIYLTTK